MLPNISSEVSAANLGISFIVIDTRLPSAVELNLTYLNMNIVTFYRTMNFSGWIIFKSLTRVMLDWLTILA